MKYNKINKISNYICNKYYIIYYKRQYSESTIRGLLLNYNGGNIDLLSEDGVYHIQYKDIEYMQPLKNYHFEAMVSPEFASLLKEIKNDKS